MVSVRNNLPTALTAVYVGGKGEMTFLPGINLNVDQVELDFALKSPAIQAWRKTKTIEILNRTPSVEGQVGEFDVSTRKSDDQPVPHQDVRVGKNSIAPKQSQEALMGLEYIPENATVKEAEDIISKSFDKEGLEALAQADNRKGVKEAVRSRLEDLGDMEVGLD